MFNVHSVDDSVSLFCTLLSVLIETVPKVRSAVRNFHCWYQRLDIGNQSNTEISSSEKILFIIDLRKKFKFLNMDCEEAYSDLYLMVVSLT